MAYDALLAETVWLSGAAGEDIESYTARPLQAGPLGGMVVIHHMPGYDAASKEITRRFATLGYTAICPNLHWREGRGAPPEEAAATSRAAGGVPDDRLVADVAGALTWLRRLSNSNGRVGVIGYCSGGRQAFLAACSLPLDAAVDCYGAFIVNPPPAELPLKVTPIIDRVDSLSCPLLGLFGAEDTNPSPDEVAELDRRLSGAGKDHEFHVFENAGHAFFAVDRPQHYRAAAAVEGWRLVADFLGRHLA